MLAPARVTNPESPHAGSTRGEGKGRLSELDAPMAWWASLAPKFMMVGGSAVIGIAGLGRLRVLRTKLIIPVTRRRAAIGNWVS